MSRRSTAARRRKALARTRPLQPSRPYPPTSSTPNSRNHEAVVDATTDIGYDGNAANQAAVVTEPRTEPQWQVLASSPALVEALTRTGVVSRPHRADSQAESHAEQTTPDGMDGWVEPMMVGHDGLMDSWPGDVPSVGRWWWSTRQYAGRKFADLRQGRLRWPSTFQPRVALGLLIALGVVVVFAAVGTLVLMSLAGAISLPNLGAGAGPEAQPTSGIVLQTNQGSSATVIVAPITVSAWASNSDPSSTDTIQVYVRVTSTNTLAPQVGASVSLSIAFNCANPGNVQGYGPTATDTDGIAKFDVTFSNLPVGQPACITAHASVGGQTYTTTATFAPSGGIIAPTATPGNPQPTPINPQPTPTHKPKR